MATSSTSSYSSLSYDTMSSSEEEYEECTVEITAQDFLNSLGSESALQRVAKWIADVEASRASQSAEESTEILPDTDDVELTREERARLYQELLETSEPESLPSSDDAELTREERARMYQELLETSVPESLPSASPAEELTREARAKLYQRLLDFSESDY